MVLPSIFYTKIHNYLCIDEVRKPRQRERVRLLFIEM